MDNKLIILELNDIIMTYIMLIGILLFPNVFHYIIVEYNK